MIINSSLDSGILMTFQFKKDMENEKWPDPYDSNWLKFITILFYFVDVLASMIMISFVIFETKGLAGHYRTFINQLLSAQYGAVSTFRISGNIGIK